MSYVGLTGGIATGKSTVCRMLADCGAQIIDADAIVHDLYRNDTNLQQLLRMTFGDHVLRDGHIDREALRTIVYTSSEQLTKLEDIVHPIVRKRGDEMRATYQADGAPLIVHDIPLLFEASNPTNFDAIIVVHCSADTQVQRVMERDHCDRADAEQRIAMQLPLADKIARADHTIDSDVPLDAMRAQVRELYQLLATSA